jgi:hypothetical protein
MKYAQILVLPQIPPGGLTAGIDWASAGLRALQARASTMPRHPQPSSGSARTARSMSGMPGIRPGVCAAGAPITAWSGHACP